MKLSKTFQEKLAQDLRELSGVELKLLLWFALVSQGEWIIIDYKEIMEATGISDKSLRKGLKRLLEKGYLEKKHKGVYNVVICLKARRKGAKLFSYDKKLMKKCEI